MRIIVAAPAKVNLWLRVGPRRPDGFHSLHTLFCALELADSLVLRAGAPGDGVTLAVGHAPPLDALPPLGPAEHNLAVRAAHIFLDRTDRPRDLHIELTKRIPAGGGLGGGSSDAAAVLRGLCRLYPDAASVEALNAMALELGSDVPFFLRGHPLARAGGRGERLTALPALPSRPVVTVFPSFPVSTAAAFRWLDADRAGAAADAGLEPAPADAGDELAWDRVERTAINDFEDPVFSRYPGLERFRDILRETGAAPALMAGSGSTLFGVFGEFDAARAAADRIHRSDPSARVLLTATRAR